MESSLKIGRVGGIEIGVHYSWLIVVALLVWSLSTAYFPQVYPHLGTTTYWLLGSTSTLLLFLAVLLHELSHSFVAKARGLEVHSITLFIFGGVSNIKGEPARPQSEFLIAIVGPITSLILAAACFLASVSLRKTSAPAGIVAEYLAYVNLLLGLFNLIPGFPLDGGRVLRSIIWQFTGDMRRATQLAALVGQVVAYGFVFYGVWQAFTGNVLGGIWIAVIGWFLSNAAEASMRQAAGQQRLAGMWVREAMHSEPITIRVDATLNSLVEDYFLHFNLRGMPVTRDHELVGMVTLRDVRDTPRSAWETTTVGDVMTPREKVKVVVPDDELSKALALLAEEDLDRLPVLEGNRLVGILSRSSVIRLLRLREELGLARLGQSRSKD